MKHLYFTNSEIDDLNDNSKTSLNQKKGLYTPQEQYKKANQGIKEVEVHKKSSLLSTKYFQEPSFYANVQVNDIIKFGSYIQESDQKEPIEWIVLDKQEDKMLVISKKILDCRRYHNKRTSVTWEHSDIRTWLNHDFLNTAFTKEEQAKIIESKIINGINPLYETHCGNDTFDKVFLLSIQEAYRYFKDSEARCTIGSQYALNHQLHKANNGKSYYWLRSNGCCKNDMAIILNNGNVYESGVEVVYTYYGVRPALWIKYES